MQKKTIGIVIVHFGNRIHTLECIDSIKKLNSNKYRKKIYLIDNDPQNRLLKNEFKVNNLVIIRNKKNLGWAAGANVGCHKAIDQKCNYLLLLNNDTVVKKNLIDKLLSEMHKKNVDILSPMIVYYNNPNIIWSVGGKLNKIFFYTTQPNMNKKISDVSLPNKIESDYGGTCLLIKSIVFKKIGYFNEKYFLNMEDVEWCFRAKKAGFHLYYIFDPLVLHKVSVNSGIKGSNILSPQSAYYYARNPFIFIRDHNNFMSIITGLIGQTFISLFYYIIFRSRSIKTVSAYINGYCEGLSYLLTGKLLTHS